MCNNFITIKYLENIIERIENRNNFIQGGSDRRRSSDSVYFQALP